MSEQEFQHAEPGTRFGQLQRGRGAGFLAALRDPAAGGEVLQCVRDDPRIDQQVEWGARYYADLMIALELPFEPLRDVMLGCEQARLVHEVVAECWGRGYEPARRLMAAESDPSVLEHFVWCMHGSSWLHPNELPPRVAEVHRAYEAKWAVPSESSRREVALDGAAPLTRLIEAAGQHGRARDGELIAAVCRHDTEADRRELARYVEHDGDGWRMRLAATALARLGDDRLLQLAHDYFAREDVPEDPVRRLSDVDRSRRVALVHYVSDLPPAVTLPLARVWHRRGGYFEVPAGRVLARHAEPGDREWLEAFVSSRLHVQSGCEITEALEALAHIADRRSAPLFATVCDEVVYSYARSKAVGGLVRMLDVPGAMALVREALWDRLDRTVELAVGHMPDLDHAARARVAELAADPLVPCELRDAAGRRLTRS